MLRFIAAVALLVVLAGAVPASPAVPSAPTEICPLLVGALVPDAEVRTISGEPVSLAEAVRGRPTLLIFYRGGW